MKSALTVLLMMLALALAGCHPGRHRQMQQQLADLQACNQADSLLTDLPLVQSLAEWFDDHGTANEQLLAHYLLGRTHADRGEAPAAIAAYHDAVERADTTATDCDYALLSRVYAQMAYIFYQQNLIEEQLSCLNHSIAYARRADDNMVALNETAMKMTAYYRLQQPDSVIATFKFVFNNFTALGYDNVASRYFGGVFGSFIDNKEYEDAKYYMRLYEQNSGYFDNNGEIEQGREIYYYYKGLYFLNLQQYDSAYHFFNMELRKGKDFNNQNAASRGLAMLYRERSMPDSAAKYALYSYAMNDSVYAKMSSAEVEKISGMYNYSHHQKNALLQKARAEHESRKATIYLSVIICLLVLSFSIAYLFWMKRKHDRDQYQRQLERYEEAQSELFSLNEKISHSDNLIHQMMGQIDIIEKQRHDLETILNEKELALKKAKEGLVKSMKMRAKSLKKANDRMRKTEVYGELQKIVSNREQMSEVMWHRVHKMVIDTLPGFFDFISSKEQFLNKNEYRCSILLRVDVSAINVSHLLDVTPSYVTKISNKLLHVFFNAEGGTKDLVEKFSEIY